MEALINIVSYPPDKPHNPMVNAGAIVISSLIKVNRWTYGLLPDS